MPTARKIPLFSDTTPEAEDFLLEGYRRMSPAEKFRRVTDLNATLEALAAARIRKTYGSSISPRELRLRLASLHLDGDLMRKAFSWDP